MHKMLSIVMMPPNTDLNVASLLYVNDIGCPNLSSLLIKLPAYVDIYCEVFLEKEWLLC